MTGVASNETGADEALATIPYERVTMYKLVIPLGERRTPVAVAHVLVLRNIVTFSMHGTTMGAFPIRPPALD